MRRLLNRHVVDAVLVALILLDVTYVVVIAFAPDTWFRVVHGVPLADPEGLLRRTAAGWASFAVFQTIALVRWRQGPHWLMFVGGIRSTEVFTDWVFVASAHHLTVGGELGLVIAPPINAICCFYFFRAYLHYARPVSEPG